MTRGVRFVTDAKAGATGCASPACSYTGRMDKHSYCVQVVFEMKSGNNGEFGNIIVWTPFSLPKPMLLAQLQGHPQPSMLVL